jgi:hypothetical protein
VQEAETARTVGIEPATKPSWSRVGAAVVLARGGSVLAFYPANIGSLQLSQLLPSDKLSSKFYKIEPVRRSLPKILRAMPHEGVL